MKKLIDTKCAFVPPVSLECYEDFEEFAKSAAVVTYSTEYFQSPFKSDKKRLRRVILSAIGVKLDNIPLTFTYMIDYSDFDASAEDWQDQTQQTDDRISAILSDLKAKCNLIRGTIDTGSKMGEALVARP
ncbi:hypothetical protein EU537_07290 [Candidatus Thorarchaeota archaeon]|nr:MAG: hypothetical protein EU537_07290 [Candidatus Thorarchaeota archaeon]